MAGMDKILGDLYEAPLPRNRTMDDPLYETEQLHKGCIQRAKEKDAEIERLRAWLIVMRDGFNGNEPIPGNPTLWTDVADLIDEALEPSVSENAACSCENGKIDCHNPTTNEEWVEDCPDCRGADR